MVQLSPDTTHGTMTSVAKARKQLITLVRQTCVLPPTEELVIGGSAQDRVLAQDVSAQGAVPRFANSAVDGFAFRHADLATLADAGKTASAASTTSTATLPLQPQPVYAGETATPALSPGHSVPITTGAPMPPGADSVCMLEDAQVQQSADGQVVSLPTALKRGSNMRPAGEDFARDEVLAAAGQRFSLRQITACLASAVPSAQVYAKPRVMVRSTGDEIAASVTADAPQVLDSNGPMLAALFANWGAEVVPADDQAVRDDLAACVALFERAQAQHVSLLVTTGAVSTGDKDFLKQAFVDAGGNMSFWKVGMKPGRPVAVGTLGTMVWIGLPGNPVAALVTACQLALPALRAAAGETNISPPQGQWVVLNQGVKKKAGRREFLRARLTGASSDQGLARVDKFHKTGAGMISGLTWSDGLVEVNEHVTQLEPGARLWFTPWESYRL